VPHGIMVLEVSGEAIAALDAYIEPALLAVFGFTARSADPDPE
jgi:hypothetical protein